MKKAMSVKAPLWTCVAFRKIVRSSSLPSWSDKARCLVRITLAKPLSPQKTHCLLQRALPPKSRGNIPLLSALTPIESYYWARGGQVFFLSSSSSFFYPPTTRRDFNIQSGKDGLSNAVTKKKIKISIPYSTFFCSTLKWIKQVNNSTELMG